MHRPQLARKNPKEFHWEVSDKAAVHGTGGMQP